MYPGEPAVTDDALWQYRVELDRVVDGDTVYLLVDMGMHVHSTQSIRLRGVDTPELFSGTDRVRGAEAKACTQDWFAVHHHVTEWPYRIKTDKDKQSFNRYVADITCVEGHDLAAHLIEAGY